MRDDAPIKELVNGSDTVEDLSQKANQDSKFIIDTDNLNKSEEDHPEPSSLFYEGMSLLNPLSNSAVVESRQLLKKVTSKKKTVLGIKTLVRVFASMMKISTVHFGKYEVALSKKQDQIDELLKTVEQVKALVSSEES